MSGTAATQPAVQAKNEAGISEPEDPEGTELWKKHSYQEEMPERKSYEEFRNLMIEYSGIPSEHVDQHIRNMRDKAFSIFPYPCIGLWAFTNLSHLHMPEWDPIIARLSEPDSPDRLLDFACCVGQTVRQLVHARGVPPSNLRAADLRQEFLDLGFEFFQDRDRFGEGSFLAGDVLDRDDKSLASLDGKITIIFAANFFHLFLREAQLAVGERLTQFFVPPRSLPDGRECVLFGCHLGSAEPGEKTILGRRFLHDQASFQKLWDEIGEKTGTKWVVDTWRDEGRIPFHMPFLPVDSVMIHYRVKRVEVSI